MSFDLRLLIFGTSLLLPACADQGSFPSLLPRAAETRTTATPDAAPPVPDAPADPALLGQVQAVEVRAREGDEAFSKEIAGADAAVAAAGSSGSESWVRAQVAISRLEGARAPTVTALADIEQLARDYSDSAASTAEADRAAIAAARARIEELADRQRSEIERLSGRLPTA